MSTSTFENDGGEGVVAFEPNRTRGPDVEANSALWYAGILVNGVRVFHYGAPCGTCGVTFRKLASPGDRVSDAEAANLLESLDRVPAEPVLRRLARILPEGSYRPVVVEATARYVLPGASDDYFATDVVHLFGPEARDDDKPQNPGTSYYRLLPDHTLASRSTTGRHETRSLLTQIAMPLHDPATLDRGRVKHWKREARSGRKLTAFAVSVMDAQSPAEEKSGADACCPYERMILFTHCLLDGHHRVQAASELGVPVRVLAFVRPSASLVTEAELGVVLERVALPRD